MMFILASTSHARQALLKNCGLIFESTSPEFEEVLPEAGDPVSVSILMAQGKARSIAHRYPELIVLGADQVGEIHGHLLGKPASKEEARAQLQMLSGDTHRLVSAVALVLPHEAGTSEREERLLVETTTITFRTLDEQEIEHYLKSGEWRGSAGGYRIETLGMNLVAGISGDYSNILGLPMLALLHTFRQLNINPLLF